MTIKRVIEDRGIKRVVHFTRAENLPSILEKGLCPRSVLHDGMAKFNDELRLDGHLDAVCASIEFPNYKLFYQLRMDKQGTEWAVLELNPSVLYDYECAFFETNAASREMKSADLCSKMGACALNRLYSPVFEGIQRDPALPLSYPTNPQAEVLVFGVIPTSYINRVCFNDISVLAWYNNKYGNMATMCYEPNLFSYRKDYDLWRP